MDNRSHQVKPVQKMASGNTGLTVNRHVPSVCRVKEALVSSVGQ